MVVLLGLKCAKFAAVKLSKKNNKPRLINKAKNLFSLSTLSLYSSVPPKKKKPCIYENGMIDESATWPSQNDKKKKKKNQINNAAAPILTPVEGEIVVDVAA